MQARRHATIIAIGLGLMGVALFIIKTTGIAQTMSNTKWQRTVTGRVISKYGPVENARVRVAGEETYALTDRQGRFELQTGHLSRSKLWVTAGKEGWFNNGQVSYPSGGAGDISVNAVSLNDRPDYRFISPVTCSGCHVKLTRYWDQSKMAHTTSNPKVLEMYNGTDAFKRKNIGPGYKLDNPKDNGNCAACHAPSTSASTPWSTDLNKVLRSPRTEWDGISCDYCHKVRKVLKDQTKPSGYRAILERRSAYRGSSILVYGPYDDVVVPPMAASYNPLYDRGSFCSMCHSHLQRLADGKTWEPEKIYSPSELKGFGIESSSYLPVQTTYQEWKLWQDQLAPDDPNKGKKCQDCHMSWRKEMLPYDNYVVDGNARNMWATKRSPRNIRPHHFAGGTKIQLKTALAMELEGEIVGNILNVNVYITNTNGGHWVPTGETMRSVMLLIDAVSSNNKPLKMIKGTRLPKWAGVGDVKAGNYSGHPGTVFARVLEDDDGNINVPFWRATSIASDTRIRQKQTVTLTFQFALEDPDDEPTVEAKLIYRPVIKPLAEIKNWTVKDILITSSAW